MILVLRSRELLLVALVALLPACAAAQTAEDACLFVPFPRDVAVDYELQMAKLTGSSAEFRAAELALSKARLALTTTAPKDLYEAKYKIETLRMKSLASDAVAALRSDIARRALSGLSGSPPQKPQQEAVSRRHWMPRLAPATNSSKRRLESSVSTELPKPLFEVSSEIFKRSDDLFRHRANSKVSDEGANYDQMPNMACSRRRRQGRERRG